MSASVVTSCTPTLDPRMSLLRDAQGAWLVEPLPAVVPNAYEYRAYASLSADPDALRRHRYVLTSADFALSPAAELYAAVLMFSIDARLGRGLLHECARSPAIVAVCLGDGRSVSNVRMSEAVAAILGDRRLGPLRLAIAGPRSLAL